MRWSELKREPCSVARTLSVIGDRWTLLILRDCFLRVRRFDEFQQRLGITRHVLAARLRKLVQAGVLQRASPTGTCGRSPMSIGLPTRVSISIRS